MSEKKISITDGIEDVVAMLRGLGGEYPGLEEIKSASGSRDGLGMVFYRGLIAGGGDIARRVAELDAKLQTVEQTISAAIAEHRETDAAIADDLRGMLADLEDVRSDVKTEDAPGATDESQSGSREF